MSYKVFGVFVASVLISGTAFAQNTVMDQSTSRTDEPVNTAWKPSLVKDGAYDVTPHISQSLAWQPIREADILWKKRVWREIDTREKQNMPFRYPGDDQTGGGYFIEILVDAIKKGKLKAYSSFSDRFTTALTKEQIMEALTGKDDSVQVPDPRTGEIKIIVSHRDFNPDLVVKYRLKEDWIFDRNQGRMVNRIIGIAPIINVIDPNTGESRGSSPLFWIYYPEARSILAQYEVFNPDNDMQRLTWDDYMEGRFWSGRIIKVSNPFDEYIQQQHSNPYDALYQGDREAERVFNKEHDMWVY